MFELAKRFKSSAIEKTSFDRFGDDLTELIVGYLPIEDKFRFQCLNKRIRNLIFNKQWVLKLSIADKMFLSFTKRVVTQTSIANYRELNYKVFEQILVNLRFLTDIVIDDRIIVNSQVLVLISDYCQHLRRLAIPWVSYSLNSKNNISSEAIQYFGLSCGRNIRSLSLSYNSPFPALDQMRLLLSLTPELFSLKVNTIYSMYLLEPFNGQFRPLLPKLKEIKCDFYNEKDLLELQTNYPQLIRIKANLTTFHFGGDDEMPYEMSPQAFHRVLSGFSQFKNLQTLDLWLDFEDGDVYKIWPNMRKVAEQCQQLTRLSLCMSAAQVERHDFLSILGSFVSLTSLQIMISHTSSDPNTNSSTAEDNNSHCSLTNLRRLTRLKHLNISYEHLSDNDFANIGQSLTQLQSLFVWTKKVLTDKSLEHCSQVKTLKALRILSSRIDINESIGFEETFSDCGVKQLMNNCQHLKSLQLFDYLNKPLNITDESINAFILKAKHNPKIQYYLALRSAKITDNNVINNLPNNLKIDIRSKKIQSLNKS